MEKTKSGLARVGGFLIGVLAIAGIRAMINGNYNNDIANSAATNSVTFHNSNVSSCVIQAKKSYPQVTDAQANSYCECAVTGIEQKYPDLATNEELKARYIRGEFNREETDLMAKCSDKAVSQ